MQRFHGELTPWFHGSSRILVLGKIFLKQPSFRSKRRIRLENNSLTWQKVADFCVFRRAQSFKRGILVDLGFGRD